MLSKKPIPATAYYLSKIVCGKAPSYVSDSLLASIAYRKFGLYIPLYSQEQDFHQMNAPIGRTSMASWLITAAQKYLKPLYDYFHQELLKHQFLIMDETRTQNAAPVLPILGGYFLKAIPKGRERDYTHPAVQGFMYCNKLFEYERAYKEKGLSYKQVRNRCQKDQKPVVEGFLARVNQVNPGSDNKLKKSITYTQNRRDYLVPNGAGQSREYWVYSVCFMKFYNNIVHICSPLELFSLTVYKSVKVSIEQIPKKCNSSVFAGRM